MRIGPAAKDDAAAIWEIIGPTIRAGETYALAPGMSEAEALAYWMGPDRDELRESPLTLSLSPWERGRPLNGCDRTPSPIGRGLG